MIGRSETERRVAINTIGPWWDGNEVWLIVAGAAMFAAFPGWYATMFSALYLALRAGAPGTVRARRLVRVSRQARECPLAQRLVVGADDRERPGPTADRGRARRSPARPSDQPAPRLHRELLRPADRLRADDRRDPAGAVPAPRRDVHGAAHDRRDPRPAPRRGPRDRRSLAILVEPRLGRLDAGGDRRRHRSAAHPDLRADRRDLRAAAGQHRQRRLGVRRLRLCDRRHHRPDLHRPVSERDGLEHEPRVQPDRQQRVRRAITRWW